jgi:hypothetical protein
MTRFQRFAAGTKALVKALILTYANLLLRALFGAGAGLFVSEIGALGYGLLRCKDYEVGLSDFDRFYNAFFDAWFVLGVFCVPAGALIAFFLSAWLVAKAAVAEVKRRPPD